MPRSLLIRRRRGGRSQTMFQECIPQHGSKATTPSAPFKGTGPFIDGAATPPHEEGTTARLQHLHSLPARAGKPCGITLSGCASIIPVCQGLRSFHSLNPWLFSFHASGVDSRLPLGAGRISKNVQYRKLL